MTGSPETGAAGKLLGLEVIRFLSAIAVLVWHYQHFFYVADQPVGLVREQQPFHALLGLFYTHGHYGVQVFWCISGFIFFWKYREAIAAGQVGGWRFFVLRFSRLYPLHLVTLLLVAVLQAVYFARQGHYFVYQFNDGFHFGLQLALASNWGFQSGYSFNGPIWSISLEVLAYLTFFVVLRFFGRSALVSMAILSACVLARLWGVQTLIVDCLMFFYAGGIAAIAFRFFESSKRPGLARALALAAVLLVPVSAYATSLHRHQQFVYWFLLIILPVLLYLCARDVSVAPSVQRAIEAAGNMTYSSYLAHFPIQIAIALWFIFSGQTIPVYSRGFFLAFMAVTLLAAWLIYRLFERPAQDFIRGRLL